MTKLRAVVIAVYAVVWLISSTSLPQLWDVSMNYR